MKLSDAQIETLRYIDAGNEVGSSRTVISLWHLGLITEDGPHAWKLTPLGRVSMNAGKLMASARTG